MKHADYRMTGKKIRATIGKIREGGDEVGIHGSFGTHLHTEDYRTELRESGISPVYGNRFHFLMFDPEKSVDVLEQNGIRYDTSLMFAEQIGFRRGCCSPFYLYNFRTKRISTVLEIPLAIMDTTLRNSRYMKIDQKEAMQYIIPLVDITKKYHGVLTVVWHNNFFSDYKYKGWKEVYTEMLEYAGNSHAWLTNGQKIYEEYTGK